MCETLVLAECGHPHRWSAVLAICLMPVVYLKSFRNIGYFSLFTLIFTFLALGLVVYVSATILSQPRELTKIEFGIDVGPQNRHYVYWDFANLPIFCNTMMNLLEGQV